jgi:hypothetical protein
VEETGKAEDVHALELPPGRGLVRLRRLPLEPIGLTLVRPQMKRIFEELYDESEHRNDQDIEERQNDATLEGPDLLGDDLPSLPRTTRPTLWHMNDFEMTRAMNYMI